MAQSPLWGQAMQAGTQAIGSLGQLYERQASMEAQRVSNEVNKLKLESAKRKEEVERRATEGVSELLKRYETARSDTAGLEPIEVQDLSSEAQALALTYPEMADDLRKFEGFLQEADPSSIDNLKKGAQKALMDFTTKGQTSGPEWDSILTAWKILEGKDPTPKAPTTYAGADIAAYGAEEVARRRRQQMEERAARDERALKVKEAAELRKATEEKDKKKLKSSVPISATETKTMVEQKVRRDAQTGWGLGVEEAPFFQMSSKDKEQFISVVAEKARSRWLTIPKTDERSFTDIIDEVYREELMKVTPGVDRPLWDTDATYNPDKAVVTDKKVNWSDM